MKKSMVFASVALSCLVCLLSLVSLGTVAVEAQVPADSVLRNFEPFGDFVLLVDGQPSSKATIYQSQRAAAFLIRAAEFPEPVLVSPRTGTVETIGIMSLAQKTNGEVDILADAALKPSGTFRLDGEDVVFAVGDREGRLRPNPPLTGFHDRDELLEHNPAYGFKANGYAPDGPSLDALKKAKGVEVRVFFGSWCPTCSRYVPYILRIDGELAGAVNFRYYGLPKSNFQNEPEAKKANVTGVPTIIVYQGGKEVGRLGSREWAKPELAILNLLGQG
jgi:thiol-disulfide isomerase/thioredoxin